MHPNYRHDRFSRGSSTFVCSECGKRSRNSGWNNWNDETCGHCHESLAIRTTASDDNIDLTGFDFKDSRSESPKQLNARFWKFVKSTK